MILEEGKIRAFQSVSLKMFDMPHQPRRMRQAVRIWRTWQAQTNLKARLKDIRGDGLSVLHKTEEDFAAAISAHGLATISPHESARPLDPTMDALRACAACRGMSETAIATLRSRVKTVTVRARGTRRRIGGARGVDGVGGGEVELKGQIEMDVSIRGDGESKALTTHCSRPGTCLNSFMDILEHVPQKWSAPGESPAAPAKSSDAPSSGQKSPRSGLRIACACDCRSVRKRKSTSAIEFASPRAQRRWMRVSCRQDV